MESSKFINYPDLDMFQKNTKRQLDIIKFLYECNCSVSLKEISSILNVQTGTILSCLSDINTTLSSEDVQAKIVHTPGQGYALHLDRTIAVKDIYQLLIKKSLPVMILKHLFFEDTKSIVKLSQECFTSESTIRRHLKAIEKTFKSKEVHINFSNLTISGNEKQVRMLSYILIWKIFGPSHWMFKTNQEAITIKFEKLFKYLEISSLTIINKQIFIFLIEVNRLRYQQGHRINLSKAEAKSIFNDPFYLTFSSILKQINDPLFKDNNEAAFLYLILRTRPLFHRQKASKIFVAHDEHVLNSVEIAKEALNLYFEGIANQICDEFEVNLLSFHYFCASFKNFSLDLNGYRFNQNLKLKYPILYQKLECMLEYLYQQSNEKIFLEKDFLIPRYAYLMNYAKSFTSFENSINLFLITDLPKVVSHYLRQEIESHFSEDYSLNFIEDSQQINSQTLIITTNGLTDIKILSKTKHIVAISENMVNRDLDIIYQALEKINYPEKNSSPNLLT